MFPTRACLSAGCKLSYICRSEANYPDVLPHGPYSRTQMLVNLRLDLPNADMKIASLRVIVSHFLLKNATNYPFRLSAFCDAANH